MQLTDKELGETREIALAVQDDSKRWQDEREQERLKGEEWLIEQLAETWRRTELSRKLEEMKLGSDQEQVLYSLLTLPKEGIELLRECLGLQDGQN